jgi:hypothetical protein
VVTRRSAAGSFVLALGAAGCSAPVPSTTFLSSVDLVDMTDRMAESFAADPDIAARGPHDDPWVVSLARVANQTNQIIPHREKWLYVGRLRGLLARSDVAARHALVWVVPPERWAHIAAELGPDDAGARLEPTHLLAAEFHALTVTSGRGRSDQYVCSFQLLDLSTGALVWHGSWEVKRAAEGRTYD